MKKEQNSRKLSPVKYRARIATLLGVMAILLLLIAACKGRPATLQSRNISEMGWKATDTLTFDIDSLTSAGNYQLYAAVRTSAARYFPFRQLVVEVSQHWLPQDTMRIDTLTFDMSANDGEVNGRGVTIFSYEVPTDMVWSFPVGAQGHVEVRHLMHRSPLLGISDVSIHLKRWHLH